MDYYKANVSFSGIISMREGEIRCITSKKLIKDLTKAGYIRKLNKKEIEAMKILGLIKEEDFDEEQGENTGEDQTNGRDDELEESDEDEGENSESSENSDKDVVTNEGK